MPDPIIDKEKGVISEKRKPDFELKHGKPLTLVKGQWEAGVSIGPAPATEPLGREMPRQKAVLVPDPTGEIFNLPVGVTLGGSQEAGRKPGLFDAVLNNPEPVGPRKVFAGLEEHNLTVQKGITGREMIIWNPTNNEKVIYENGRKIIIHPHNFYNASGRVTHRTGEHHFIDIRRQGDNLTLNLKTIENPKRDETQFYKVELDEEKFRQVPISVDKPEKPLVVGFRADSKRFEPEHGAVLIANEKGLMKEGPRHLFEIHWDPAKKVLDVSNLGGPDKVYTLLKANGRKVSFDRLMVENEITLFEPSNGVTAEIRILDRYSNPPMVVWRFSKA